MSVKEKIESYKTEAETNKDQNCYNVGYAKGYIAGVKDVLEEIASQGKEPQTRFVILNHYTNENVGTFDMVQLMPKMYAHFSEAVEAAQKLFNEDLYGASNHGETELVTASDVDLFEDFPLFAVGENSKGNAYHNIYAVFSISD